jgi:hypothetical protein
MIRKYGVCGLDLSSSAYDAMVGSWKHSNEPLSSEQGGLSFDEVSKCYVIQGYITRPSQQHAIYEYVNFEFQII